MNEGLQPLAGQLPQERQLQGYFLLVRQNDRAGDEQVDLAAILRGVLGKWMFIVLATLIAGGAAAALGLILPPSYESTTTVAPVESDGQSGMRGKVGGLAALAGIDLSSGNRGEERYAILSSQGFAREFIERENLLPVMFPQRWDAARNQWKPDAEVPSLERATKKFVRKIRSVSQDKKTLLIQVQVRWSDPVLAAEWANKLVSMANEKIRKNAIDEAEQSIGFLKQELAKSDVIQLQQSIHNLIESQINNAMMANVQHEYAFRIVEAAIPREEPSGLRLWQLVLVGAALGGLLCAGAFFLYFMLRQSPQRNSSD